MPLANFKPRTKRIRFGTGKDDYFDVRALSVWDAGQILEVHRDVLEDVFAEIQSKASDEPNDDTIAQLAMKLMREAPFLVASVIAYAADEPMQTTAVTKMAAPAQVEALKVIGELTFTDMASAKKFLADVMTMVRGILPPQPEALAAE